jgi:hypothetical protein
MELQMLVNFERKGLAFCMILTWTEIRRQVLIKIKNIQLRENPFRVSRVFNMYRTGGAILM